MVNKKGGKKHKRNKKETFQTKSLRKKEYGQEYGQITKCKGNCRFDIMCFDGKERAAILCGTMRKRKFINLRQIVLVSLRDFQDSICDIIDSYDDNQVKLLKEMKDIPESIELEENNDFINTDNDIIFENNMLDESSDDDTIDQNIDLDDI